MANPVFQRERAAAIIAESVLAGIQATCDKYGITRRALERWKKKLECDKQLSQVVASKLNKLEGDWAEDLPNAIRATIAFILRAAQEADHRDPNVIHSVTGSLKILTDVTMSRRALDKRLGPPEEANRARSAGQAGQAGESPRPALETDPERALGLQ